MPSSSANSRVSETVTPEVDKDEDGFKFGHPALDVQLNSGNISVKWL